MAGLWVTGCEFVFVSSNYFLIVWLLEGESIKPLIENIDRSKTEDLYLERT